MQAGSAGIIIYFFFISLIVVKNGKILIFINNLVLNIFMSANQKHQPQKERTIAARQAWLQELKSCKSDSETILKICPPPQGVIIVEGKIMNNITNVLGNALRKARAGSDVLVLFNDRKLFLPEDFVKASDKYGYILIPLLEAQIMKMNANDIYDAGVMMEFINAYGEYRELVLKYLNYLPHEQAGEVIEKYEGLKSLHEGYATGINQIESLGGAYDFKELYDRAKRWQESGAER